MRRQLKYTWTLFFSRFPQLTEVQKRTIPHVLAKKDALIISPTASGKTEAVIVPLIELILREKWQGLSVIYIAPTKALCNDLYFRFSELCAELNIEVTIKTGDRPRFTSRSKGILITTPESFDSLLCRHREKLTDLRALVLDEIHLLDNTYRGDQLRMLVKRAGAISAYEINVYMLSATVAEPEESALRYSRKPAVIQVSGSRSIRHTSLGRLKEILPYTRKDNLRKLLIFCNRRDSVEYYANVSKSIWGAHNVVVHHGSLSAGVRHEAERFMKENYFGVCVSTMTLEIGIDIGNLDAVVLAEAPFSLSSLLQRIGRSNRRSNEIRVFSLTESEEEKLAMDIMMKAAQEGKVESDLYQLDLGVIIQQIFSLLYARPQGIEEAELLDFLEEFCPRDYLIKILKHLELLAWIGKQNGLWQAMTHLMNQGTIGKIHSNILDTKASKVINIADKKVIGEVTGRIDNVFILAGRIWKIVHIERTRIYVRAYASSKFGAKFIRTRTESAFSYLLPED